MRNSAKLIRFNVLALIVVTAFAAIMIGCVTYVATRTAPSPLPTTAPPPLPDYEQPLCPGPGYLWIPGYWAYDREGYFWVPGMWELPPSVGWMWTPGYWSWSNGVYIWNPGYWGSQIGFYGGVNYGCGYTGVGYDGGYWKENTFYYNTAVTNVNVAVVHNTYTQAVVNNNTPVSYNGGPGGITAIPTSQELIAAQGPHSGPTANQRQHLRAAAANPMPNTVSVINTPAKHPFYMHALSDLRYAAGASF